RVDEKKIRALVGEKVEKPDADFVREQTGFVIGGVPPVAHAQKLETLIDEDLLKFEIIWGAAGTPNAVFRLAPQDLVKMTGGRVVDIKVVA
ncbi:MAG: YbaK/EbsC family protein, partial [Chloroflexi bacterium]|nr:YbaK/EbsC family protein [Chloroflexota bacterium]